MTVVLDSNIAIAAMNRVAAVVERLAKIPADDVVLPMAAIAELAYGARRSSRVD
jgi:predicted nucleic acid-binding protein